MEWFYFYAGFMTFGAIAYIAGKVIAFFSWESYDSAFQDEEKEASHIHCIKCGEWFSDEDSGAVFCPQCQERIRKGE